MSACSLIDEIILVINKNEFKICRQQVLNPTQLFQNQTGGGWIDPSRGLVYEGLKKVSPQTDIVLVHDGARPLIKEDIIVQSIYETIQHKATIVAVPAKNTIKVVEKDGFVEYTPKQRLPV